MPGWKFFGILWHCTPQKSYLMAFPRFVSFCTSAPTDLIDKVPSSFYTLYCVVVVLFWKLDLVTLLNVRESSIKYFLIPIKFVLLLGLLKLTWQSILLRASMTSSCCRLLGWIQLDWNDCKNAVVNNWKWNQWLISIVEGPHQDLHICNLHDSNSVWI